MLFSSSEKSDFIGFKLGKKCRWAVEIFLAGLQCKCCPDGIDINSAVRLECSNKLIGLFSHDVAIELRSKLAI